MSKTAISVEHNGTEYKAVLAIIRSTFLGIQDHGIMTAQLNCEWGSSSIATGSYALDGPVKDDQGRTHRVGSAFGMDHVIQIMATVGVSEWEKLPGHNVLVLFDQSRPDGPTVGIANISGPKVLIYQEHCDSWKDKEPA